MRACELPGAAGLVPRHLMDRHHDSHPPPSGADRLGLRLGSEELLSLHGLGAVDQRVRSTVFCEQRDGRAALLAVCFCFKPSAAVLHLPNNAPLANNWVHNGNQRVWPNLALIYTADPVDLIALIRRAQDGQPAKDFAASQTFQDRTENLMPQSVELMNMMGGMGGMGGMMGGMGGMGGMMGGMGGMGGVQMQAMQGVGAGAGMAAPPMATGQVILEQTMERDPAEKSIVEKLSELTALRDAGALDDDEFKAAKAQLLAR